MYESEPTDKALGALFESIAVISAVTFPSKASSFAVPALPSEAVLISCAPAFKILAVLAADRSVIPSIAALTALRAPLAPLRLSVTSVKLATFIPASAVLPVVMSVRAWFTIESRSACALRSIVWPASDFVLTTVAIDENA